MHRYLCVALRHLIFFFNDTATTEIYTLSLHDALPIFDQADGQVLVVRERLLRAARGALLHGQQGPRPGAAAARVETQVLARSEEHTSELQSRQYLVCRLLLEKKQI